MTCIATFYLFILFYLYCYLFLIYLLCIVSSVINSLVITLISPFLLLAYKSECMFRNSFLYAFLEAITLGRSEDGYRYN